MNVESNGFVVYRRADKLANTQHSVTVYYMYSEQDYFRIMFVNCWIVPMCYVEGNL
jgi:hypothetical protein